MKTSTAGQRCFAHGIEQIGESKLIQEGSKFLNVHKTNHNDTKGDSVESTDLGMYIPTGKGYGYPPRMFTDPEAAANLTDSDTRDSMIEGPKIRGYVGNYCEDCMTKWPRCICKPESDWDDDYTYSVKTQTDSTPNVENDKHPLPSDWSDQENFWNGKTYEKSRTP